ncbi:MAG: ATP-binding protein [Planctomycetaceae bacterium]
MAAPLREFTLEAREHLGAFEQALLALENEADPAARGALLARALRAIHSLKGDAGFLGLMAIRDLAHALESLLENSRREAGLPPAVIIETLLAARDQLAHLVEQPQQPPPAAGWDALWRRLNLDHEPGTAGPAPSFTPPGPTHPPGGLASSATTGSVPNLLDLRVNLDRVAERGPGSIPQFFRTLSELGSLSQGRLEPLVDTLAEPLSGETTWYRARLWTTLSPAEFPLGWPDLLSHAEIRVCDPREVAVVPLDAACESSGETLPALLTRWSRSGLLAKGRLECESTNFAAGLPAGPVWLQVERPAHMDATTWTRLLPGMDALSAGEVAALAPNAGRDQGPVPGSPAASHQPGQARGHEPARADAEAPDTPRRGSAGPASPSGTDDGPGTGPTHAASGGSVNPVEAHPVVPTGGVTSGGVTSGGTEVSRTEALRVRVELLDRLVDLVGELTLVRNQALQALDESPGHRALIQRLGGVTSQLQEAVLKTRLQPVGSLFGRFPRLVRDLSRQLGKQVELITEGTTVELDKTVLELLSDPLNHLVRNSLDHGIEAADERLAAGKPATGRLTLAATPADGQVVLEIRDDGRGIDPERVRAKALSLGWKSAAELDRMSTRELLALVLQPGFSTARQVTEISGRGVGLDVVKTNVEQLDGSLTIDSVTGQGTSIRLRVPLTMAILPCLLVTVAGERILIPQRDLEEIACLRADGVHRIETAHRAEMYRLRGELLPVVRAAHLLGLASGPTPLVDPTRGSSHSPDSNSQTAARGTAASETNVATVPVPANPAPLQHLLVVQARGRRFALVVDGVLGTQ